MKLGINIDHVATLRNVGEGVDPGPVEAAMAAHAGGADIIRVHLREDRRHITDTDILQIMQNVDVPLNLAITLCKENLHFALKHKPREVLIIPDKHETFIADTSLNTLREAVYMFKDAGIKVTLSIEPLFNIVRKACDIGIDAIELHVASLRYAASERKSDELIKLSDVLSYAGGLGLQCNVGRGVNDVVLRDVIALPNINIVYIGHFVVARALFEGMESVVRNIKKTLSAN